MATKHYVADYEIVKKGKVVRTGTVQFARINAPEDEDVDEAFDEAQAAYPTLNLKAETFKEARAVGEMKTDEQGNITERPPIVI